MGKNSQSRWKHCCALIGKVTGKHDRYLSRGNNKLLELVFKTTSLMDRRNKEERLAVVRPALKPGGGNSGDAGLRRAVCPLVVCARVVCSAVSDSLRLSGL